jgi:hypothetical protein
LVLGENRGGEAQRNSQGMNRSSECHRFQRSGNSSTASSVTKWATNNLRCVLSRG